MDNTNEIKQLFLLQRQLLSIHKRSQALKMSDTDRLFLNAYIDEALHRTSEVIALTIKIDNETSDIEESFKEIETLIKSLCRKLLSSATDKDLIKRGVLMRCLTNVYDAYDKILPILKRQKRGKGQRIWQVEG